MCFLRLIGLGLLIAWSLTPARAADYRLANGNTLRGEIVSADEDGLVVKLDIGGFSPREPWVSFSQETLRGLATNPEYAPLVEPFIELTPDELQRLNTRAEVIIREVPGRLERPTSPPSLFAGLVTPIGLLMLALLMLGNLYAAYEIAIFRNRPPMLVCGSALLLPIVGPILFLSVPAAHPAPLADEGPADQLASSPLASATGAERGVGGLALASSEKPAAVSAQTQPQVFQRGENTFNRRFFETKFPGFFRVVLSDAERDLVLVFRTPKHEYVGKRISRISSNEVHLVLMSSNSEASVPFSEIISVILKHKDARV